MRPEPKDLATPRILLLDDERQIHVSLRLRLANYADVVPCADSHSALLRVGEESFDLCIVDLHMAGMQGMEFVEAARQIDPGLGFVILSGYGTEENLRRAIPLQVYDFIHKPLPERAGFEQRIAEWIERTKARRRELTLVKESGFLVRELGEAQIARDIEFTASESARDALLQSANLLTTIHALLANATQNLDGLGRPDIRLNPIIRSLQEARRAAEAATSITERFFSSAYANRDTSPAQLGSCLGHAAGICARWAHAEQEQKIIDLAGHEQNAVIRDISGIELLLLLIPAIGAALEVAPAGTTVQVRCEGLIRLDAAPRDHRSRDHLWVNRKSALLSHPGIFLVIKASGPAFDQAQIKSWLEGGSGSPLKIPARGLVHGLTKCKGMLGIAVSPPRDRFDLVLALPT